MSIKRHVKALKYLNDLIFTKRQIWIQTVLPGTASANYLELGRITCDFPQFLKQYTCKYSL